MPKYRLNDLSPYEFELLIRDLLEDEMDLQLESFTTGRDNGIDLRYSRNLKNDIVIQCKHFSNSTVPQLLNSLKKEKEKLKDINPGRYIVVTSLGLTPNAKEKIVKILDPYIKEYADIIDLEKINNLISKYPTIEKRHYKLWLTSGDMLRILLNNGIYNRSSIEQDMIIKRSKIYVQNESYGKALEILEENHYCIISGVPGIGKTTLSEILALKYLTLKYELITIASNIDDAFKVYDKNKKQVFLFDDFLGSIFFENKTKDINIYKFIQNVNVSNNTRFILTTREYILNQAEVSSEIYSINNLKKCIIKQEYYTDKVKAHILYNHLYFSGLPEEYLVDILKDKKYHEIIKHKNYNPRIIEWMTNILNVKMINDEDYTKNFIDALNNPKIIWKIAFEKHINTMSRNIIIILGLMFDEVELNDFITIFKLWENDTSVNIVDWMIEFKASLKELNGTFIKIDGQKIKVIKFHNPSIKDFIISYLKETPEILIRFTNIEMKYWDQFIQTIDLMILTKNKSYYEIIINLVYKMVDYINYPIMELENNLFSEIIRRDSDIFKKIRLLLKILIEIEHEKKEVLVNTIYSLFKIEIEQTVKPTYNFYKVISVIIEIKGYTNLEYEQDKILKMLQETKDPEDLNEFLDIVELLDIDKEIIFNISKNKIDNMIDEYIIGNDETELNNMEELFCELMEKVEYEAFDKLIPIRERIEEIEEQEYEFSDSSEHDDELLRGATSFDLDDILGIREDEKTSIDRMFESLL